MAVLTSKVNIIRATTVVLGIIVVGLGYYSHFSSSWTKHNDQKPHESCEELIQLIDLKSTCPGIGMERYFIGAITICLILSLLGLLIASAIESKFLRYLDTGYHALGAMLLISAGVMYLVSTQEIENLMDDVEDWLGKLFDENAPTQTPPVTSSEMPMKIIPDDFELRRTEKIISAIMAIINGVFYIIMPFLIWRGHKTFQRLDQI